MKAVRVVAPLRISFAGGGTDVPPYPELHGGAVLSATIRRYATATAAPRPDHTYQVHSADLGASAAFRPDDLAFDGHMDLVKAVLRDLDPGHGVDLTLATDAPPGSGLGSSSALVVAMLAAVGALTGRSWSPSELARRAHRVERVDLGIEGGMQDQYAAAYGGFNHIEFGAGGVAVHRLDLAAETIDALERSLLLAFSGSSRTDTGILRRQVAGVAEGRPESLESLEAIKSLVSVLRDALLKGDLDSFADGLHAGWEAKRRLADGVSNARLDTLYEIGRTAGAAGGKVLGAGGGGYLVFCCPPERRARVASALECASAPCAAVAFDPAGVRW